MSTQPPEALERREGAAEIIAGFLAAAALAAGAVAVAYKPVRLGVPAIILALVAAAMASGRSARLATFAVVAATACWVVGMVIAVLTRNPLW